MNTLTKKPAVKLTEAQVLTNNEIAPSVLLLTFNRDFEFIAGQVLGITIDPEEDARLYSIASGTAESTVKILYNIKPGGKLTPPLSTLVPGNKIWISVPFGNFKPYSGPAYWISAGTGIAPYMSMFYSGFGDRKIMIHGGRSPQSFYFSEELIKDFGDKYIRCCSGAGGEGLYHGRVTTYLENLENLPRDHKYYLCGSAEMVVDCREILLSKDVPYNNIVAEIYF
jgi:ferredoxin--NADP+ reductase